MNGRLQTVVRVKTIGVELLNPVTNLRECLDDLSRDTDLDTFMRGNTEFKTALTRQLEKACKAAFLDENIDALREVHGALFALYDLHTCDPADSRAANQYNTSLIDAKNVIEAAWLSSERAKFDVTSASMFSDVPNLITTLWLNHPASAHPLFDYLETRATKDEMEVFFLSDKALNVRFFDLIALALVGSREDSRQELVQNIWDESGNGDHSKAHVRMFNDLVDSLSKTGEQLPKKQALDWQGLAGYNLFMMCAINRQHYFKSLGVMAITELMDPSQYEKVVRGCRRLGFSKTQLSYYEEHIGIDVVHGQGWLNNVIAPTAKQTPAALNEILFGAHLRLSSRP